MITGYLRNIKSGITEDSGLAIRVVRFVVGTLGEAFRSLYFDFVEEFPSNNCDVERLSYCHPHHDGEAGRPNHWYYSDSYQ